MENVTTTIIGNRPLSSITEEELAVLLDMTGECGCKEYWGEPTITHVDRNRHENAITVYFTQTRVSDGETSDSLLEINFNTLTYHASYFYPFERMSPTRSVLQKPKIFLWLLRQQFNVMELLSEDSYVDKTFGFSCKAVAYVIADVYHHDMQFKRDENGEIKFYGRDESHDAILEHRKMVDEDEYTDYKIYELIEVKEGKRHRMKKCVKK